MRALERPGEVSLRSITVRAALVVFAASAVACASSPKPSPAKSATPATATVRTPAPEPAPSPSSTPRAPDAIDSGLVFAVEPAEAEIAIDGRPAGTVADLSTGGGLLRLAPGIYQVSIKATGFVTWRAEVALRSGTETIRVKLARKP